MPGNWTSEESGRLRSAVENFDPPAKGVYDTKGCWKSVAQAVGGDRDHRMCRERWYTLHKVVREWTPADDVQIQQGYERGVSWSKIAAACFPGVLSNDVGNRFKSPAFTARATGGDDSARAATAAAAVAGDDSARAATADAKMFTGAGAEGWRAFPRQEIQHCQYFKYEAPVSPHTDTSVFAFG